VSVLNGEKRIGSLEERKGLGMSNESVIKKNEMHPGSTTRKGKFNRGYVWGARRVWNNKEVCER